MTLTNAQGKCLFSGKDCSSMRGDQDLLRDSNNSSSNMEMNIEFMESIGAIGFGPTGVKTQTNEIITGNDEIFDKKSFLFNC